MIEKVGRGMERTRSGRRILLVAPVVGMVTLLLAACATTYHPLAGDGGYSDYQLSQTQYYVYFLANAHTSQETAYRFFLTRAAQIALEKGFKSFYVFKLQNSTRTRTYVTPGSTSTYIYRDVVPTYYYGYGGSGFLNSTVYSNAVTVYNPPQYFSVNEPGYRGQILLTNEQLKGQPPPFDAKIVYDQGMALNKQIKAENGRTALAVGAGTALIIGVVAATVALTPANSVYVY